MQTNLKKLPKLGWLRAVFLIPIISTCITCCKLEMNEDVVITGDLLSPNSVVEGKMLYLGDNNTRAFLDSVAVKNGKFQFRIKPGKGFIPVKASILYATNNPSWPYQLLGFKNPFNAKTEESTIFTDRGEMHLRRDTTLKVKGRDLVRFIVKNPNKQTQAAFRHLTFRKNPERSAEKREFNITLVKKYPFSVDLLNELEWSKSNIADNELAELISLFEPSLQNTVYFRKINRYLEYHNTTGDQFPTNLSLKKPDNTTNSNILDKNAEYNLVVFWASWCGPCRLEIPQLKKLHAKYKGRVNITSISTDKNAGNWKKALQQENMPWSQFIVDEETVVQLDKKYNLQSIPLWLLFDSENNLIQRKVGYGVEEESVDTIVEIHLLKHP